MTTTVNHQLGFLTGGMQERAPDQGRIRGPNEKAAAPALLQPGERLSYNRKFLDEKRVGVKKKTSGRYFDKGCLRNAVMTDGLPIMGLPVWFRGNEAPPQKKWHKMLDRGKNAFVRDAWHLHVSARPSTSLGMASPPNHFGCRDSDFGIRRRC